MEGEQTIQNDHSITSEDNSAQSNEWKHNTAVVAQALIVLDLEQVLVRNMKNSNKGTLNMHLDCELV